MLEIECTEIISKDFEDYMSQIIGEIDCGEKRYLGDNIIIDLEKNRVEKTKKGIIALYQTYMSYDIKSSPEYLKTISSLSNISSSEFELIICQLNGTLLNIAKDKSQEYCDYYENVNGGNHSYKRIAQRAIYYRNEIEVLIVQNNERINNILSGKNPLYEHKKDHIVKKMGIKPFKRKNEN